jgi:hypothetical protein
MRSEADWTRWGDDHPYLAAAMQLGIYLLCWVGFFALIWGVFALASLVGRILGA